MELLNVGIAGTQYDEEKYYVREVAPPGFGHTKKGGTAAAFDKARKEGRFKGSKSDMFAIMWAMKKKGAKPKYKPGTDKKYKKYQEEGKLSHLAQASVLSASDDPKDQDRAREIKTRFDYESLKRQIGSKEKHNKPAYKDFVKKARKK